VHIAIFADDLADVKLQEPVVDAHYGKDAAYAGAKQLACPHPRWK
jgi:hypothetical protein